MPEIHRLTVQTTKPGGTRFPHGAVEIGYWYQDGDFVFLCDADGVRTGDKIEYQNRESVRKPGSFEAVQVKLLD